VCSEIKKAAPDAFVIIVSNPLDAMCHVAYDALGFPRARVCGMAGVLDTARYKTFVAMEVGCSVEDVHGMVLGGHGDTMVPLPNHTSIGGIPLRELVGEERVKAIVERTAKGGAEIVSLLKTGSAYYAPASSVTAMVESYLRDKKRVLPCAALLDGQYGHRELFIGVPCVIGAGGIERVIELALSEHEKKQLDHSAGAVRELVEAMGKLPS
jgi:malate dehydrogenase